MTIEEQADKYIREQYIDYGDLNDQAEIQIRDAFIAGTNLIKNQGVSHHVIGQFCDCIKDESDGADVNGDCVHCGRKHR